MDRLTEKELSTKALLSVLVFPENRRNQRIKQVKRQTGQKPDLAFHYFGTYFTAPLIRCYFVVTAFAPLQAE